jgi:hypothetical protein
LGTLRELETLRELTMLKELGDILIKELILFFMYPKKDLNPYDIIYQRSLSSSCLPIPALGLIILNILYNIYAI